MSESYPSRHETSSEKNPELKDHRERIQEHAERHAESAKNEHAEKLSDIRSRIEAASKSRIEHDKKDQENNTPKVESAPVSKELKELSYRRTLKRVQNKLPAPQRTFSKFVHSRATEVVSETASKTVARPSGVLAGGIFAFLGSSLFLYITKHYGYEYNYLLFSLFFIGGFFVGLLVELGIRFANRKR